MSSHGFLCTRGVFPALAFAADFRQLHPNFRGGRNANASENLGTIDKKSSRKIKYKKIPRVHFHKIRHRKIPGEHKKQQEEKFHE